MKWKFFIKRAVCDIAMIAGFLICLNTQKFVDKFGRVPVMIVAVIALIIVTALVLKTGKEIEHESE